MFPEKVEKSGSDQFTLVRSSVIAQTVRRSRSFVIFERIPGSFQPEVLKKIRFNVSEVFFSIYRQSPIFSIVTKNTF